MRKYLFRITLALREVNYVLIPEADFDLDGECGLLSNLEWRLKQRRHALIVVAEGAGECYFTEENRERDPSGNLKPGNIGHFLQDEIKAYFKRQDLEVNLKYIDPSYLIRSMPANYNDRIYCGFLGQNAVHAGMAGKTAMLVSRWHSHYVHIPIQAADWGADLIVLGHASRHPFKELLLGNINTHILRDAPCSVLISKRK